MQSLLAPLREGKAVWLKVDDRRLPKKTRKYPTVLMICPMDKLGIDTDALLVAMPPYGSEIVDPATGLKPSMFARLGLSFSLSSALAHALRLVLRRSYG